MKINGWGAGTIIVACFLLTAFGYELNAWLAPVHTHAQEAVTTIATQGRFQLIRLKTNEDMLLDTATGKVFDFYNGGSVLKEIPIKACSDAECTTQKGVADAR
jgi:hypothetical protein